MRETRAGPEVVDWPRLLAMLDDLKDAKNLDTDRKVGTAIGSPSVIYQWRKEKVRPEADTLVKLAEFAGKSPRPVPHLAHAWRWLEVAGYLRAPDGGALTDAQRDLLTIADSLRTPAERQGLRDLALAYMRAVNGD